MTKSQKEFEKSGWKVFSVNGFGDDNYFVGFEKNSKQWKKSIDLAMKYTNTAKLKDVDGVSPADIEKYDDYVIRWGLFESKLAELGFYRLESFTVPTVHLRPVARTSEIIYDEVENG